MSELTATKLDEIILSAKEIRANQSIINTITALVGISINAEGLIRYKGVPIIRDEIVDEYCVITIDGKRITEPSFKDKTIKTLKEEAELLNKARINALDRDNFSDYKLLIDNYKKVINLIQELEEDKNPVNYNINVTTPNVTNVDEFINRLKEIKFTAMSSR